MKAKHLLLRLLLSGGLIAFLFATADTGLVAQRLAGGQLLFLLVAYLVALLDRVLMAYKWGLLLRAKEIRIPLPELTATYLVATFLGLFLPATLGSDALRAYAVSRGGHQPSHVISSIIVERLAGLVALLLFALASILVSMWVLGQGFLANAWTLFAVMGVVLVALLAIFVVSLHEAVSRRLAAVVQSRLRPQAAPRRLLQKVHGVYGSYQSYRDKRAHLAAFLLLSLAENFLPVLWGYYLSLAFGIAVPLLYFFILTPIVLVLVRLPISLDGFGLQEGTFVYFLALVGVPPAEAFLLGLASHLLAIASLLPGAVLYWLNGLRLRSHAAALGGQLGGRAAGAPPDAVGPE